MDIDKNIEKLLNNLTIEENKESNSLNNNEISHLSVLDRIEKKYNVQYK